MEPSSLRQTRAWVESFVVAHDICPFAGREMRRDSIRYVLAEASDLEGLLHELVAECRHLDAHADIATTLLIAPAGMDDFDAYLDWLELAERLMEELGYVGIYQLASFHPDYVFDGVAADDPANATNRSPWPMLHILREAELERAIANHADPEGIPERNMARLREPGSAALAAGLAARGVE
ncbi:DUF1415 domain-containing protein [Salinicola sp. JS01]|uniref:DUF1415 domain-containing protein n=1 Tax=Salinicola sp. JS01 TaxID=3050071 RepID=UPI0004E760E5|nr:DUF1415 domain-containing protein [Salinicola sp. JS01]KFF47695.1 hypothetical protein GY26_18850 [Gammaproteobacteria bacterium MFB021]WIX34985.1 DUF1415 domain-containing protein [Salinicola sp. JS01]